VTAPTTHEGERCDRCGSVGEDRRTLWMACFYRMDELAIPFAQVQLIGTLQAKTGERALFAGGEGVPDAMVPTFAEPDPEEKPASRVFYTLRVCKRCRGEWMRAIADWFAAPPAGEDHDGEEPIERTGTGVFRRTLGAIRELTPDEVEAFKAELETGGQPA
jgi:hypothetical protein